MTGSEIRYDPVPLFPEFYANPHIRRLGGQRLWTVSDSSKRPVDLVTTLDNMAHPARRCPRCGETDCRIVHGAQVTEASSQLMTLPELTGRLPRAANAAMHFDWSLEHCVVLDIEPQCPPQVTDQLLRLVTGSADCPQPPALYSELSMSGLGYHVLLPLPAGFTAAGGDQRSVIRHPMGWFEVLLHHWITFSRKPIPAQRLQQAAAAPTGAAITWDGVFAQLVAVAPRSSGITGVAGVDRIAAETMGDELDPQENWLHRRIVRRHLGSWAKDLRTDYFGDTSRWEYARLRSLAHTAVDELELRLLVNTIRFDEDRPWDTSGLPDDDEVISSLIKVVYAAALEVLPPRLKHEGFRSGMPYLLKRASSAVSDALVGRLPLTPAFPGLPAGPHPDREESSCLNPDGTAVADPRTDAVPHPQIAPATAAAVAPNKEDSL